MESFIYHSPIGSITACTDQDSVCGLWMQGQKFFPQTLPSPVETPTTVTMQLLKQWLDDYFTGLAPSIKDLKLAPCGSAFQHTVWKYLCTIPYGSTETYGEIANTVGNILGIPKLSPQAIGGAVGRNPISIIIPCHRVIGSGNRITGYAGDIPRKEWLLQHESNTKYIKSGRM